MQIREAGGRAARKVGWMKGWLLSVHGMFKHILTYSIFFDYNLRPSNDLALLELAYIANTSCTEFLGRWVNLFHNPQRIDHQREWLEQLSSGGGDAFSICPFSSSSSSSLWPNHFPTESTLSFSLSSLRWFLPPFLHPKLIDLI